MSNGQDLSAWLQTEMGDRDWTQSDLARYSGLHRAIISKIILGGSKPMPETLDALARALKVPSEKVFRIAGLLPSEPKSDPWVEEQNYKLRRLSPRTRSVASRLIDSLVEEDEAEQKAKLKAKPAKA